MSTMAQIDANRANALLSTGPRTPEGIAATRHNATRHGLTGKQVVIKGEDPAQYDSLRQQLIAECAPANEREAMLVEDIAQNYWRLLRARKVEAEVISRFGEVNCILDPDARKAFATITRYLNAIEKSWRKSTKDLDALQSARRKNQENERRAAAIRRMRPTLATEHPAHALAIGSVSQPPSLHPSPSRNDSPPDCR
jgi:hypothetical protein